jgi:hypothetical protein
MVLELYGETGMLPNSLQAEEIKKYAAENELTKQYIRSVIEPFDASEHSLKRTEGNTQQEKDSPAEKRKTEKKNEAEKKGETEKKDETRKCITGWSRYGVCSCCRQDINCCNQCGDSGDCNSRCGWIDEPYTHEEDESISGQICINDIDCTLEESGAEKTDEASEETADDEFEQVNISQNRFDEILKQGRRYLIIRKQKKIYSPGE